jgi:selenide,water dikinase
MLPGGIESNRRYVGDSIVWSGVSSLRQLIMLDPQTSGGLLISLPEEEAGPLAAELEAAGFLGELIGRVSDFEETHIRVE